MCLLDDKRRETGEVYVLPTIALNFSPQKKFGMIEMLKIVVCTEGEMEAGLL